MMMHSMKKGGSSLSDNCTGMTYSFHPVAVPLILAAGAIQAREKYSHLETVTASFSYKIFPPPGSPMLEQKSREGESLGYVT